MSSLCHILFALLSMRGFAVFWISVTHSLSPSIAIPIPAHGGLPPGPCGVWCCDGSACRRLQGVAPLFRSHDLSPSLAPPLKISILLLSLPPAMHAWARERPCAGGGGCGTLRCRPLPCPVRRGARGALTGQTSGTGARVPQVHLRPPNTGVERFGWTRGQALDAQISGKRLVPGPACSGDG